MSMDVPTDLQAVVLQAYIDGTPLNVAGGGSKSFLGPAVDARAQTLSTSSCQGIVSYQPNELFITAKAGTPLKEVEQVLADHDQAFAFEPPQFAENATLGGMLASGLSGPARPWGGAVRDHVLGLELINGKGELLRFGGQVIKNVAGYDVSRLMVGAFGSLGVITEVTIRTLPLPAMRLSLVWEVAQAQALQHLRAWMRQGLPLTAATWHEGRLRVRLGGAGKAVERARQTLGGESFEGDAAFWGDLREQRLPFFGSDRPLWRLSLPLSTPALALPGETLVDWAGAQRWLCSDAPADVIRRIARDAGGHATLFRHGDPGDAFSPLDEVMLRLHRNLKAAFDPRGILNPGCMGQGL